MKFSSILIFLSVPVAQTYAQSGATFSCSEHAAPCGVITSTCLDGGRIKHCIANNKEAGCKQTDWSHVNWYAAGGVDLVLADGDSATATCENTNSKDHGCSADSVNYGIGIKDDSSSGFCVTVDAGVDMLVAIKDKNTCGSDGSGWNCVQDCHCGGSQACVTKVPGTCDDGPDPVPPFPQVDGDPHFKSWSGKWFDYMGQCDLKFIDAPMFDGQQDININIRTKLIYEYSYVEAAAIQIGEDVLEVGEYGDYALNGVDGAAGHNQVGTLGGYAVFHNQVNKKKNTFDVVLGPNQNITLASYKNLVSVHINVEHPEKYFGHAKGIIGSFSGDLLSRSGQLMDPEMDEAAFGQEWQITDEEPMIFRNARAPQYPAKCEMAFKGASAQRRLGETIAEEAARKACAHKTGAQFNNCVYDVMAIGDLELANSGVY